MKMMFTLLIVGIFGAMISDVNAGGRRRIRAKSKVNTRWEKRADKNNDGRVGPKEARKAKAKLKAKSVVDTKWEEKADKNDDGKISRKEFFKARRAMRKHRRSQNQENSEE